MVGDDWTSSSLFPDNQLRDRVRPRHDPRDCLKDPRMASTAATRGIHEGWRPGLSADVGGRRAEKLGDVRCGGRDREPIAGPQCFRSCQQHDRPSDRRPTQVALAISSLCSLHSVSRSGAVLSRGTNRRNADTNQPFPPKLPAHLYEGNRRSKVTAFGKRLTVALLHSKTNSNFLQEEDE